MRRELTTTHLLMKDRSLFKPRYADDDSLALRKVGIPNPNLSHFLFMEIGTPHLWYSRLEWDYATWEKWLSREDVDTWVGYRQDSPYGYFELQQRGTRVEFLFFGILRQFVGRGLGGHLLSEGIRTAWSLPGVEELYLHTCTLDHPHALDNYRARGFEIIDRETDVEEVPDEDDPIWTSPAYYSSLRRG